VQQKSQVNKNFEKIDFSIKNWEKDTVVKLQTIKIKLLLNTNQKKLIDNFINTARYVYNKTLSYIKNEIKTNKNYQPNLIKLRDKFVTSSTKKTHNDYINHTNTINELHLSKKSMNEEEKEKCNNIIKDLHNVFRKHCKNIEYKKNITVNDFELETHKDIRSNALKQVVDAYKSARALFSKGIIKFYNIKFISRKDTKNTLELSKKCISMTNGVINILPNTFKNDKELKIANKNKEKYKDLSISNNVDIVRSHGKYYIYVLKNTDQKENQKIYESVCAIDPGVRSFATIYSINKTETSITEIIHEKNKLNKYNKKIDFLKSKKKKTQRKNETDLQYNKRKKKCIRKKQFRKIENKKINYTSSLHWFSINYLLKQFDVIMYGDIRSSSIVKGGKNKKLNRDFNDLKFYQFKTKLLYKASLCGKIVEMVSEHNTTKCCSRCGNLKYNVGSSKIYNCDKCNLVVDRDINSSKNIFMKGIL
jgi:IS605 OrfB family transposase